MIADGRIVGYKLGQRILRVDLNEIDAIAARIAELKLEHRDLDDVIFRLIQTPVVDQLQLQRLKKRKLMVKDQITLLERQLTPDILA